MRSPRNDTYRLPDLITKLLPLFSVSENHIYLVGGAIRNSLLHMKSSDIDLSVKGNSHNLINDICRTLDAKHIELDKQRGISRIILKKNSERFQIDITRMDGNLERDTLKRDFSINAIVLNTKSICVDSKGAYFQIEDLYDPCNGTEDIESKTLKATHNEIFSEDPIRLLRAIRIASEFDFNIAANTKLSIKANANLLSTCSPERVRDEFLKILSHKHSAKQLRLLDQLELLHEIVHELPYGKGVIQPKQHYWDVFNHQIECVDWLEKILNFDATDELFIYKYLPVFENMTEYFHNTYSDGHTRKTLCKIACLLHDIAKPFTKTVDEGKIRFLGHHVEGSEISKNILHKLHFSKKSIDLIATQILHHLRPGQIAPKGEKPSKKAIYRYYRDAKTASIDTLYLNLADFLAARGPMLTEHEWKEHCQKINLILKQGFTEEVPTRVSKLLTGHDIMVGLGLNPGPEIGKLIEKVEEAQIDEKVKTKEEALDLLKKIIKTGENFEKKCQNVIGDRRHNTAMCGNP